MRALLAALMLCLAAAAHAQSEAQRAACTPDVMRLCHPGALDLLSHRRICGCMAADYAQLSARCRALAPLRGLQQCADGH